MEFSFDDFDYTAPVANLLWGQEDHCSTTGIYAQVNLYFTFTMFFEVRSKEPVIN